MYICLSYDIDNYAILTIKVSSLVVHGSVMLTLTCLINIGIACVDWAVRYPFYVNYIMESIHSEIMQTSYISSDW